MPYSRTDTGNSHANKFHFGKDRGYCPCRKGACHGCVALIVPAQVVHAYISNFADMVEDKTPSKYMHLGESLFQPAKFALACICLSINGEICIIYVTLAILSHSPHGILSMRDAIVYFLYICANCASFHWIRSKKINIVFLLNCFYMK